VGEQGVRFTSACCTYTLADIAPNCRALCGLSSTEASPFVDASIGHGHVILNGDEPVLAIKVTQLDGGGTAIGLSVHHKVADSVSLLEFVTQWARSHADAEGPRTSDADRTRVDAAAILDPAFVPSSLQKPSLFGYVRLVRSIPLCPRV
jgi:hypothetical protein